MEGIVGYRFIPTGQEIIRNHLEPKIEGNGDSVGNLIPEVNINNYDPDELPDLARITTGDGKYYFYHRLEKMSDANSKIKRSTKTGFWKPAGKDKEIKDANGHLIGIKKALTFRRRNNSSGIGKASWIMHEFHHRRNHQKDYILCKLIQKGQDEIGESDLGSNHQAEEKQEIQAAVASIGHVEFEDEV